MEKCDSHSPEYYESYLLGKLTEEEEISFEEHLLFCEECRYAIHETEAIIEGIKTVENEPAFSSEKGKIRRMSFLQIAASIILLIAIPAIYLGLRNSNTTQERIKDIVAVDTTSINIKNDLNEDIIADHQNETTTENDLLAVAYIPSAFHEKLLKNTYRSEQTEVVSPIIGQIFQKGEKIHFIWDPDSLLNLVIMDNKGNILTEEEVNSSFQLIVELSPGLYYWQIENDDESLYTGKFEVK